MSVAECSKLETTFRSQIEALSHSMWVLTGLMGLIRQEGYVPKDQTLFHQLVSSLSMGLAHQANIASAGASFTTLKRRHYYVDHLKPVYPDCLKRVLLASPALSSASLFREEDIARLVEVTNQSSSISAHQSMVEVASSLSRSRSPRRSPARSGSSFRPRSPRTPVRSPKRVRFSSPRSSPHRPAGTSKSPPPPKQNFGK